MASQVEICNRALQKLGAKRIVALSDDSRNARACNVAYDPVRLSLLRSHPWNCATARAELAANSTTPAWGRANSFPLPSDFVRMVEDYPEDNSNAKDWVIEGRNILTDDSGPIYLRYIYDLEDPNEMDSLFREALSCLLALELSEEITQSNTKKESIKHDYSKVIAEARKANAFENVSSEPPEDTWLTARL
ncbi:major capsid protein [Caudoviricetes sp.]|nr:major capsid protein [Caudoviricetes sp.]